MFRLQVYTANGQVNEALVITINGVPTNNQTANPAD